MKVMISLPMNGKTDDEIYTETKKITDKLNELHIEVVASNFKQDPPDTCQHPPLFYMAKSIDMISKVDAVFFHKDWRYGRGCRIEREICRVYGVKILDWNFAFEEEENIRYKNSTRLYSDNKEVATVEDDGSVIFRSPNSPSLNREAQMTQIKEKIQRFPDDVRKNLDNNHVPHID